MYEWLRSDVESMGPLLQEGELPVIVTQGSDAAVVGYVEVFMVRPLGLLLKSRHQVVAIEVVLEHLVADLLAFQQIFFDVGITHRSHKRWPHVFVGTDVVYRFSSGNIFHIMLLAQTTVRSGCVSSKGWYVQQELVLLG